MLTHSRWRLTTSRCKAQMKGPSRWLYLVGFQSRRHLADSAGPWEFAFCKTYEDIFVWLFICRLRNAVCRNRRFIDKQTTYASCGSAQRKPSGSLLLNPVGRLIDNIRSRRDANAIPTYLASVRRLSWKSRARFEAIVILCTLGN